ncbi:MAG: hypothetical protein MJY61_05220 [Bacteroidales bacterium]|nr:hypothetical protein [Bacteroidales bacterium]
MKKNLLLIGALAFAGLFASCQKENVVTPSEPASEQKVITIDVQNGGKAEIEPLLALGESIVIAGDDVKKDSELEILVKKVVREFVSVVRSMIGAHVEEPVQTRRYIGNMKAFGLVIDQIRQLSYNAIEGENNFVQIRLGDATELKVGSFEILPISNFGFAYNYNTLVGAAGAELYNPLTIAPSRLSYSFVENGLFIKFKYRGSTYMTVIYAGQRSIDLRASGTRAQEKDTSRTEFGFIYGYWMGLDETLIDLYDDIVDTESGIYGLPIDATVSLRFANQEINNKKEDNLFALQYRDFIIRQMVSEDNAMEIDLGTTMLSEGAWHAQLQTKDVEAGKAFVKDFITAQVFGVSQSECNALTDEFNQAFPALEENNRMDMYPGKVLDGFYTLPLALGSEAASGMIWKPAFGVNIYGESDTQFVSFNQLSKMSDGQRSDFWMALEESHSYYRYNPGK